MLRIILQAMHNSTKLNVKLVRGYPVDVPLINASFIYQILEREMNEEMNEGDRGAHRMGRTRVQYYFTK